jgi:hypothetical protein
MDQLEVQYRMAVAAVARAHLPTLQGIAAEFMRRQDALGLQAIQDPEVLVASRGRQELRERIAEARDLIASRKRIHQSAISAYLEAVLCCTECLPTARKQEEIDQIRTLVQSMLERESALNARREAWHAAVVRWLDLIDQHPDGFHNENGKLVCSIELEAPALACMRDINAIAGEEREAFEEHMLRLGDRAGLIAALSAHKNA